MSDYRATVLAFGPGNWFGRATAFITRSRFCHVGIDLPGVGYFEAVSEGVRYVRAAPWGAAIGRASVTVDQAGAAFLLSEVGKTYSWSTIVADLLDAYLPALSFEMYRAGEYDCSALVAEALHWPEPHLWTPASVAYRLGIK